LTIRGTGLLPCQLQKMQKRTRGPKVKLGLISSNTPRGEEEITDQVHCRRRSGRKNVLWTAKARKKVVGKADVLLGERTKERRRLRETLKECQKKELFYVRSGKKRSLKRKKEKKSKRPLGLLLASLARLGSSRGREG